MFSNIELNGNYSRDDLTSLWGYAGPQALRRGVVTPKNENKIILFVTENKKNHTSEYKDRLLGDQLEWEGPNDHFAEQRMLAGKDQIHIFYRKNPRTDFIYLGQANVISSNILTDSPSQFTFALS